MARNLTSGVQTAIDADVVRPVEFIEIEFASTIGRVHNRIGDLSWNGYTWTGIGHLGSISGAAETTDLSAQGVRAELAGIDPTWVGYILDQIQQGRPFKRWVGFLDENNAVISDPYLEFEGTVDSGGISEDGVQIGAQVTAENDAYDRGRTLERRWTAEDQRIEFPGDTGFDRVAAIQELNLRWGGGSVPPIGVGVGVGTGTGGGDDLARLA